MSRAVIAWAGGVVAGLLGLLGIAISNIYWPLIELPEVLRFAIGWIPVILGVVVFHLIEEQAND